MATLVGWVGDAILYMEQNGTEACTGDAEGYRGVLGVQRRYLDVQGEYRGSTGGIPGCSRM